MDKLIGRIVLCGAILNLSSESAIREDMAVVRICNASDPIDVHIFNDYMMHHNFNHLENQAQHELACFLLCIYSEHHWMDRHGSFRVHNIRSWMLSAEQSEIDTEIILERCTKPVLSDPCNRAREFTECFWSTNQGMPRPSYHHALHSMIRKADLV
ncbi:uncharacterized protein [Fopius arisanus]|uniref:Uncharacterized protein n=1 Tax=Fopius arisanus TaxID=64838 RepID=A0A9R1TUT1_9HYME|nr:PREDICTED: uncharacterized protein LOC105262817 [Fopius arisanus]